MKRKKKFKWGTEKSATTRRSDFEKENYPRTIWRNESYRVL